MPPLDSGARRPGSRSGGPSRRWRIFDAFVAAAPSRVDGRVARSRTRAVLGRFEEAESNLDQALRLDPGDARSWAERGALRLRTGRAAAAKEDLSRALEMDACLLNALVDLSVVEHAGGHPDRARKTFADALKVSASAPRDRLELWKGLYPGVAQTLT